MSAIVLVGSCNGSSCLRCGYSRFKLPYLAIGSPTQITVPGIPQIRVCDLVESKRRVETRGELIGERLVVDEAICVGRADRMFVKVLGIELAAFDTCNLRAHQRGAVFEILRAMPRPKFELSAGGRQEPRNVAVSRPEMRNSRLPRGRAHYRSNTPPFQNVMVTSKVAVAPSMTHPWRKHSPQRRTGLVTCGPNIEHSSSFKTGLPARWCSN